MVMTRPGKGKYTYNILMLPEVGARIKRCILSPLIVACEDSCTPGDCTVSLRAASHSPAVFTPGVSYTFSVQIVRLAMAASSDSCAVLGTVRCANTVLVSDSNFTDQRVESMNSV